MSDGHGKNNKASIAGHTRIHARGWRHRTFLEEGVAKTYQDFVGSASLREA